MPNLLAKYGIERTAPKDNLHKIGRGGKIDIASFIQHEVTDKESKKVIDDIIDSCEYFNSALEHISAYPNIYLDYSKLKYQDPSDTGWKESIQPVVEGKFKGVLTKEHILTMIHVMNVWHNKPDSNIQIWGACQGAKTIIFDALFAMMPIIELLTNHQVAIPIINVPNNTNLSLSAIKELNVLFAVYDKIQVCQGKAAVPFNYVRQTIMNKVINTENEAKSTVECLVLQRNRSNIESFLNLHSKNGHEVGSIICFTDEMHFGSSEYGEINRWLDTYRKVNPDVKVREIGITATPGEALGSGNWVRVNSFISENYCGLTTYHGEKLVTISGRQVKIQEFKVIEDEFPEIEAYLEMRSFKYLRYFVNVGNDSKKKINPDDFSPRERKHWMDMHQEYKQEFAENIVQIYKSLVTPEFPIAFIRPFQQNIFCQELFDLMQEHLGDDLDEYNLLKYFGEKDDKFGNNRRGEERTIKEVLVDSYVKSPGRFCLVITGSGRSRMGDSYPPQCKHFIDLSESIFHWDTHIQGTSGRSQGFNKQSICFFKRNYVASFKKFLENGCYDKSKRLNHRTDYNGGNGRGRPSSYSSITFDDVHQEI